MGMQIELVRWGSGGSGNCGIQVLDSHFLGSEIKYVGILIGGVLDIRLGQEFISLVFVRRVNRNARDRDRAFGPSIGIECRPARGQQWWGVDLLQDDERQNLRFWE